MSKQCENCKKDICDCKLASKHYDRGYQQGRADTLKECWDKYDKIGYGFFEEWLAEQLKEQ